MMCTFAIVFAVMVVIGSVNKGYGIKESEGFKLFGGAVVIICGLGFLGFGSAWLLFNIWR